MSLTTTAKNTKLGFLLVVIFIVVYLFGAYILIPVGKEAYRAAFPPKNPPTPIYGALDPIEFESKRLSDAENIEYTLLTTDGKLPRNIPDRMTVYKFKGPSFSYEAGKRASREASALGFSDDNLTTSLKGDEYTWVEPRTGSNLVMDIRTRFMEMKTPIAAIAGSYSPGSITRTTAPEQAKQVLRSIGRFSDPLYTTGTQSVALGVVRGNVIEHTSFQGEAEIARVDFFRSIEDYPIVGPTYGEGLIRTYVGIPKDTGKVIAKHPYIYYNYNELETESNATYPIIPVATAWEQVMQGKGVISKAIPNTRSAFEEYSPVTIEEILVTQVFLAYYDDVEKQEYLRPIYVFEGNYTGPNNERGDVAIYYPAITGAYTKGTAEVTEEN
jgi:hypothetical protein